MTDNRSGAGSAPLGGYPKLYFWQRQNGAPVKTMVQTPPPHLCPSQLVRLQLRVPTYAYHGPQAAQLIGPVRANASCGCRVTGNGGNDHPIQVWACPFHRFPGEVLAGRPHTCPPNDSYVRCADPTVTHGPRGAALEGFVNRARRCGCTVVGAGAPDHPLRPAFCLQHSELAAPQVSRPPRADDPSTWIVRRR